MADDNELINLLKKLLGGNTSGSSEAAIGSTAMTAINPILGTGVTALISLLKGAKQKQEAAELEKNNQRPVEQIPTTVKENIDIARQLANTGLSGTELTKAIQNIARVQSSAISSAQTRKGGLDVAAGSQSQMNDALVNLASQGEQFRRQGAAQLMGANAQMAEWQDKVWSWNQQQKYMENAAAIRALKGAGDENKNIGVGQGLSAFSQASPLIGALLGTGLYKTPKSDGAAPTTFGSGKVDLGGAPMSDLWKNIMGMSNRPSVSNYLSLEQ